jgi:hypothetical protein
MQKANAANAIQTSSCIVVIVVFRMRRDSRNSELISQAVKEGSLETFI